MSLFSSLQSLEKVSYILESQAKSILKNFADVANAEDCKGEWLLLSARVKECEAASLICELHSGSVRPEHQDVLDALELLNQEWHHIPTPMKATLASRNVTVQMQGLVKDISSVDEGAISTLVQATMPMTGGEDNDFDGKNPTFHAITNELLYNIGEKLDMDTFDPDAAKPEDLPFRQAAQARTCGYLTCVLTGC